MSKAGGKPLWMPRHTSGPVTNVIRMNAHGMTKWFGLVLILSGPVSAQETDVGGVSNEIIAYWAKNAIPLAEFVEQGFGMAEPKDATSPQWCPYQAVTISLLFADHPNCSRLLQEMRQQGRIE